MNEADIENFMKQDFVRHRIRRERRPPAQVRHVPEALHEYVEAEHVLTLERAGAAEQRGTAQILA